MKFISIILLIYLFHIFNSNCESSLASLTRTFYISESNPTFRLLSKDSKTFTNMPNLYYGHRNDPLYQKCTIEGYEIACTFTKKDIFNNLYESYIITEIKEDCNGPINTKFTIVFVEDILHCEKYDDEEYTCTKCESLYKYDKKSEECKRSSIFWFLVIGLPIIIISIVAIIVIVICVTKKNNNTVLIF